MPGIGDLPLIILFFALAAVIVVVSRLRESQPIQTMAGIEDAYPPAEDEEQHHIWVSSETLRELQPVLAQIQPGWSTNEEIRLLTRWHWLSLLRPTGRRRKRKRKPMKTQELLLITAGFAFFGPKIVVGLITSSPGLAVVLVVSCALAVWTKWLRWQCTYLVITDHLIAVVTSPPRNIFWINRKPYPFPLGRIENVSWTEITALRQLAGEVGSVHASTLGQIEDDWILDMKMLPEPAVIYGVLYKVCPKLQTA